MDRHLWSILPLKGGGGGGGGGSWRLERVDRRRDRHVLFGDLYNNY